MPAIDHIIHELKFTTSRSGGPGGQNVNKVNTKVTLRWDVANSATLSEDQKEVILAKLPGYINNEGVLVLSAQASRSQLQNKEAAISRLAALLHRAFSKRKPRKPTRPTKAAIEKRLTAKKKLAEKKRLRRGLD